MTVDVLTPGAVILTAKNPPPHVFVFRLDNKNTKSRDQNMINLGGAVFRRKDDVMNASVKREFL
jgi:hypothetical protein